MVTAVSSPSSMPKVSMLHAPSHVPQVTTILLPTTRHVLSAPSTTGVPVAVPPLFPAPSVPTLRPAPALTAQPAQTVSTPSVVLPPAKAALLMPVATVAPLQVLLTPASNAPTAHTIRAPTLLRDAQLLPLVRMSMPLVMVTSIAALVTPAPVRLLIRKLPVPKEPTAMTALQLAVNPVKPVMPALPLPLSVPLLLQAALATRAPSAPTPLAINPLAPSVLQ